MELDYMVNIFDEILCYSYLKELYYMVDIFDFM